MKLGEKKTVITKLTYNQANILIGLKLSDYIKHYLLGVSHDSKNNSTSS